jgi:hypothetical protein
MKKLILLSLIFCAVVAQGAIILTEPFNYADGTQIKNQPGWASHSSADSGPVLVTNNTMRLVFANAEDVNVTLPNGPYTGSGLVGSLYASMVLNFESTGVNTNSVIGNYFAHFWDSTTTGINQTNGFRGRIFAQTNGAPDGTVVLGLTAVGGTVTNSDYVVNPTAVPTNTPTTIVVKLDLNNGNSQLWVNPGTETDPSIATAGPGTSVGIDRMCFRQVAQSATGVVRISNLKVGSAFSDVAGTNTPPTLAGIPTVRADTAKNVPITIPFTVTDDHNPASSIITTATSSNIVIVPNGNITITNDPDGIHRYLNIIPGSNRESNAVIKVVAKNPGNASNVLTFTLFIGAPSMSAIPTQVTTQGAPPTAVNFQVSDRESAATTLAVNATSSNTGLVPNSGLVVTSDSSGTNRTLTITPAGGQTGLTTITLTCRDNTGNNTVTNNFVFDVSPSYGLVFADNFDSYADGSSDQQTTTLSFLNDLGSSPWIHHSGTTYQLAPSNHSAYISVPLTNSEDIHANLTNAPFTTSSGVVLYYGFTMKQLSLPTSTDGDYFIHLGTNSFRARIFACRSNAAPNTFRLGISSAAAFPAAVYPLDLTTNTPVYVTVRYNVGSGEAVMWVNASSQSSPTVVANDNASTISEIYNICLRESGGGTTGSAAGSQAIDNLKVSTSFSDVFTPFPLTVSAIPNQNLAVSGSSGPISYTVTDSQDGPNSVTYNVTSDNTALLPTSNIALAGSGTNRTISVTPVAGQSGFANVALTVSDSLGISITRSFLVTVGNPPTNGIVISEFYPGGGNAGATYNTKFVELFNHSGTPVSLNNWSLQYASSNGTSFSAASFNNVTVPAYSYYLVALGAPGTNGTALPVAADFTMATINPSQAIGKLALVNSQNSLSGASPLPNATVADFIGYGTGASGYEGSGPVAWTVDNTKAMFRLDGGCTDTDNNAADFASAAVTPHNSASAINVCQAAAVALRAFVSGNNFVIAWPTSATGFTLETASTVNQNPWTSAGSPSVVGSENQVSVPIGNAAAFFRLKK